MGQPTLISCLVEEEGALHRSTLCMVFRIACMQLERMLMSNGGVSLSDSLLRADHSDQESEEIGHSEI